MANSIQADYDAYLALLALGEADDTLPGLVDALYDIETDLLTNGLTARYRFMPPAAIAAPPWIVHVPGKVDSDAVFTLDSGFAGNQMEIKYHIDIFIAGGGEKDSYSVATARAYALFLPLMRLIAKNQSLEGAASAIEFHGATPETYPLADKRWKGLAVHFAVCTYQQLPAG